MQKVFKVIRSKMLAVSFVKHFYTFDITIFGGIRNIYDIHIYI